MGFNNSVGVMTKCKITFFLSYEKKVVLLQPILTNQPVKKIYWKGARVVEEARLESE